MLREELAGYAEYAAKVRYRLIPALIYLAITVRVTAIEDQMLRDELAGYAEYAAKVRYRLIPGIWKMKIQIQNNNSVPPGGSPKRKANVIIFRRKKVNQMAKLEISTVINRPVEEVFAFVSNYENLPKWNSLSSEVKKTSEGPIGVGTTYRTVVKFLGQRIEGETEVTEYEPDRSITHKAKSGPFPVENRLTFERVEGGTRVSLITEGEPGGFFKLAEPLLVSMLKRQFEADLANLKDLMEAHAL